MANNLINTDSYWTPWEHQVCSQCHGSNPYAIWLVKVGCFQPHRHIQGNYIHVVIDSENIMLEPLRPMPGNFKSFYGAYTNCKNFERGTCRRQQICSYAHSDFELDMWNIKKRLARGDKLVPQLSDLSLESQSPSEVCQACLEANGPKALWLSWVKCTSMELHKDMKKITVVVSRKRLVRVHPLPASVTDFGQVKICTSQQVYMDAICFSCSSKRAHSIGELLYWRWQIAKKRIFEKDSFFMKLNNMYGYPDEHSEAVIRVITKELTVDNYYTKYHNLVYLEEMESSRKIIAECDSKDTVVRLEWSTEEQKFLVFLMNLSYTSMDYASYHKGEVTISLAGGQQYSAQILGTPDYERNALVLPIPPQSTLFQLCSPPDRLVYDFKASAHFEIDHQKYLRLHKGIDCVVDENLRTLIPTCPGSCRSTYPQLKFNKQDERKHLLDRRYQLKALNRMLSSNPSIPYLLLGPFGTGKTYLLAAAVAKLIEARGNQVRVLVCTHSKRGADGLYKDLQVKIKHISRYAARVVGYSESSQLRKAAVIHPDEIAPNFIVLVTTFGVALNLVDLVENGSLIFSHIFIDEGAQCPEPEVLGALVLATTETRITIVGDNKQVGPQVRTLSERARENGLGKSLLERLFSHYNEADNASMTKTHTSSLLTNYRCHASILMLASSLFYECALLSHSKQEPHPKAPYPLAFLCTSMKQVEFNNCSPENEEEAKLLITKMIEFIQTWHPVPTKPFGLLASTKQQVACLRRIWKQMKQHCNFHVEILPTYNIQGEEFSTVFLSTCEPTDGHGAPSDQLKSICNEYVFNTVVTRAQSLIFVAGNPFFLLHMGSHFKINCWKEYIRRCIQCQSFELPNTFVPSDAQNLPRIVGQLCEAVFLSESIQQAMEESLDANDVDIIVERYLSDLNERQEYKVATKLVQKPSGGMSWVEEKLAQEPENGIVWCRLDCRNFHEATARPVNPNAMDNTSRYTVTRRKGIMHGGMVKVDIIHKCVLFDEDTEKALASTHFGESYLCRVDPKNPILFFPLDRRYPKFINLPVLSVRAKNGVICFDPKSINSSTKVNNFIPLEVATKMLFMVKFLGWQKKYSYPLGIIVGALPSAQSPYTGELLLRISNNIPLTSCPTEETQASTLEDTYTLAFTGAFTIDPEGSPDHDDALTCRIVSKTDSSNIYEIGVHITNVERYIPKDSPLDKKASQRGCAAYRSPDHCISCMLPEGMIQNDLSILQGSTRYALSVLIQYSIDNKGTIEEVPDSITFAQSKVQSDLALTYEEAQNLLFKQQNISSDPLYRKIAQYNHQSLANNNLSIEDQLSVLWKIAMYTRQKRIGEDAAYSFIIEDPDDQRCPEAHILIQELMIWTNKSVAIKLLNNFPNETVLRVQNRPSEKDLIDLIQQYEAGMSISLALRSYAEANKTSVDQVHILSSVYSKIRENLENGQILKVCHQVQFEHLHPQIAVAIAGLHQSRRSCGADYVVSTEDTKEYWHDTLQCAQYTHFTSPIRRYIDIVVQRLLRAAIHKERCPYNREELQEICRQTKEAVKRSNNYAREVKRLDLATRLRKIGQQVVSIIQQITEDAEIELSFIDPLLRVLYPRERSIALKHLNALTLPIQEKERSESIQNPNQTQSSDSRKFESLANDSVIWQAKISSFQGTAMNFISNPMLQVVKNVPDSDYDHSRYAEISLLSLENEIIGERSNLIENKMIAKIFPLTEAVSACKWAQLQEIIKYDRSDQDLRNTILKMFSINDNTSNAFPTLTSSPSPMWIYKLHRPINMSEVLHVQLTASHLNYFLSPTLQLVEVGPELRICIQHNQNVSACFADELVNDASKRTYNSMEEYFKCWEQVLLYEAVNESLAESELLLIRDVSLEWPKLSYHCDSLGQASYKLVVPAGEPKAGVMMEIPNEFMTISHDFFTFRIGDLLCIRYNVERNQDKLGFVLHMVIHHIDPDPRTRTTKQNDRPEKVKVYLKFVGNNSNFISPQIAELLTPSDTKTRLKCEVQLLSLTLPFRRVYRCLHDIRLEENLSSLALRIAKGTARMNNTTNLRHIDTMMTMEEASVSTSIWPLTRRDVGSGRKKLNPLQKEAIKIACNNHFTIIQGPPGTGKSVTGAHLAYAFAKKLRKEQSSFKISISQSNGQAVKVEDLRPCVMYCGPSNQAVNVVLNYLIQDGVPVKDDLKILRIFSKTIEQREYPGPKMHDGVFPKFMTSEAKCEPKHEKYALHKKIRSINPEIRAMDIEFKELNKQNKIPSVALRRKYRSTVFNAEVNVLKSGFDIILCTCNEASSHRIAKSVRPVYCIVDECAMCTEPECMVPIQRAEHVVLIGDHQQLRPVIKSREAEAKGLGKSLFERYAQKDGEGPPLQEPYMLKIQYRMHEKLCEFPSKEFYGGQLETDKSVKQRNNPEVLLQFWPHGPRKPFVFVHVEGIERETHTGRKGKARVGLESKYNKQEARKIAEVAAVLVNRHHVTEASITALTPYSAQKEEIKKRLQDKKLLTIPVKTITESQGSESGIILLSTVRSKPRDEISIQDHSNERKNADIGWIRRNLGFVTDRHQICVGLTRCKYGLVIVGNQYLLSYDKTWGELINHYKKNGCVKDGDNFPC